MRNAELQCWNIMEAVVDDKNDIRIIGEADYVYEWTAEADKCKYTSES